MTFNFDEILDNTARSGAVRVVHEQHDSSKINWARGLSDPGEMIACGYMPEARRLAGETDAAYQKRLESMDMPKILGPERMAKLLEAANRRAALDTTGGKVAMFSAAGMVPWHGLGVTIEGYVDGVRALKLAHMDWDVKCVECYYKAPDGEYRKSASARSVIRMDNGFELGSVGMRYEPFTNKDGIEFGDAILGLNGAHWETLGSIYGGRRCWALMKFSEAIEPVPGDVTEPYGLLTWTHDGSGQVRFLPTGVRVECANTQRVALLDGRGKGCGVKHTKNVKQRLKDAARALGFCKDSFKKYEEAAETLVRKEVQVRHYASDVLDTILDVSEADVKRGPVLDAVLHVTAKERELAEKSFERKVKHRKELLSDILERYESERCRPKGSAWAAFNAVTESVDHGKFARYRGGDRRERRFESVLLGAGDDAKQVAFEKAMAV